MRRLVLALYAEGTTDERFLSPIIQRTTVQLLRKRERSQIDVIMRIIPKDGAIKNRDECILQAAHDASDCDVLIVHSDADAPTREKAYQERFFPGYELVKRAHEGVCTSLIPVIPIRMTEAWTLAADYDLLCLVLRTSMTAQNLGLVSKVKQVEADPDPKKTLRHIVQKATAHRSKRHRETDISSIYTAVGERISLDRLEEVPSYQQFVKDLTATFKKLNLIQ